MSDPFASAQDLAQFTGMDLPEDLARWQMALELASAATRRYCGQTLSIVVGDVVTLEPIERDTLLLPERPVTAITTVVSNGITLSSATDYHFTRAGRLISGTIISPGTDWTYGATVTYDHGYAESAEEYKAIKMAVLAAAARVITLNKGGGSEVLGVTNILESAGYAPEVFLTPGEKMQLADLGKVLVG